MAYVTWFVQQIIYQNHWHECKFSRQPCMANGDVFEMNLSAPLFLIWKMENCETKCVHRCAEVHTLWYRAPEKRPGKKLITPSSKQRLNSMKEIRNKKTKLNLESHTKYGVFPVLKHHLVLKWEALAPYSHKGSHEVSGRPTPRCALQQQEFIMLRWNTCG